uniref:Similar to n=1 Tax=Macrostomum lignano TaxID=282301 RepID=A0A1I8HGW5_9PLAT
MTPTQTQRQQVSPTLPLPPTPAPTSSVAQDRLTSISASSFETLTTTLASASLADVGNSTTRRRRSSSNRQNGNDETAEDLDGYLLMMPSSRRASTSGTSAGSSATPSGRHSAAAAAVGLPAVIADEYVLPVSGRYAQIDWSQVMQDSLQYLDSSSSRAAVGATSAAAAAVRDEPLAEDSSDVLKYVSIDSARTQAIRDLIVDKVDSGRSRLMTDI